MAKVQILVDDKECGDPIGVSVGDQVLYTHDGAGNAKPYKLTARRRIKTLEAELARTVEGWNVSVETIYKMAAAQSLDEVVGIAYRGGYLGAGD